MTIVAFRDGIMAADTATWAGDVMRGHSRKITRTSCGAIVAAAGDAADCERFRRWAETHGRHAEQKWHGFEIEDADFEGIIVEHSGAVIYVDGDGRVSPSLRADFHVLGCAADLAHGAMLAGASAEEAVALCIKNHAYAGGEIQLMMLLEKYAEAA